MGRSQLNLIVIAPVTLQSVLLVNYSDPCYSTARSQQTRSRIEHDYEVDCEHDQDDTRHRYRAMPLRSGLELSDSMLRVMTGLAGLGIGRAMTGGSTIASSADVRATAASFDLP